MHFNKCFEGVSGKRGIFHNGKLAIEVFFLSRPAIDFSYYRVRIDSEFSVGALENILIDMQGMGFFNSMMNKVVTSMVQQNVHTVLMASGKDFMKKEFVDCSLLDHMYTSFKIL